MNWLNLFSDYTLQNVSAGAVMLGTLSGTLGSFAVLRRQSLIGDTLSHAALPGICLGFIIAGSRNLPSIVLGALVSGLLAAVLMMILQRHSRLKLDAILGSILSVSFAVGVVLLTWIQNNAGAAQAGLDSFLFGQAAAILRSDLILMGSVTAVALVILVVFWKELKVTAFDPLFAHTMGLPVTFLETALTFLVAVAVVMGLQMVGVVLMSAMIIAPAVAARQWVNRLEPMLLLAAVFGAVGGLTGALLSSLQRGLSTGPLVVLAISTIAVISILFAPARGVVWEGMARSRQSRTLRSRQLLTTMLSLAEDHNDMNYPVEQGMLNTYFGIGTGRALRRLEKSGLVRAMRHMPGEGQHWQLSEAGHRAAQRILDSLTRREH